MIAGAILLGIAGVIHVTGPRLARTTWPQQAPRLAIFAWQALSVSAVVTVALAGITWLIPMPVLAGGLGAILHACAVSIAAAYGSAEPMPATLLGALLGGVLPAWVLLCAGRVLIGRWRSRHRLRRMLGLMIEAGPTAGVVVVESPTPAAFCVPGRGARIVLTRGAVEGLPAAEMDGVLAHEAAHLRGRHNLAIALSQVLTRAFPHVPLFRIAARETRQLLELLADDAAARSVDRVTLASAIVTLAEMKAPAAAMAMAQDAAALRVTRLLAPERPLEPWRSRVAALSALGIVLTPVVVAGFPAICAAVSDLCNI